MSRHRAAFLSLLLPMASTVGAEVARASGPADSVLVCLAPVTVQATGGAAAPSGDPIRDVFGSYLNGPTLGVVVLKSKLSSQAREEAKRGGCASVLFVTLKQARNTGVGLLNKLAGRVETQALKTAASARSTTTRDLAKEAAGAAHGMATSVKSKDELTLDYRLESTDGAVLASGSDKRKAGTDGEDLLTPLVEKAAEAIATAAIKVH